MFCEEAQTPTATIMKFSSNRRSPFLGAGNGVSDTVRRHGRKEAESHKFME